MRTSTFLLAVISALLILGGCGSKSGGPVLIRDTGDYQTTLTQVQDLTKDALARWRSGQPLTDADQKALADAIPLVEGLTAFSPNSYGPHYIRGMIADAQGQAELAERSYLQALRLPPEKMSKDDEAVFALCYFDLAQVRFDAGKFEIADEAIGQALALQPENPEFQVLAASIAVQRGDTAAARTLLEKALKTDPANPRGRDLKRLLDLAEKP